MAKLPKHRTETDSFGPIEVPADHGGHHPLHPAIQLQHVDHEDSEHQTADRSTKEIREAENVSS